MADTTKLQIGFTRSELKAREKSTGVEVILARFLTKGSTPALPNTHKKVLEPNKLSKI